MSQYLVDTNGLLSYFTDRSPKQQRVISDYVDRASRLEVCLHVTPSVITELVFALASVYGESPATVADVVAKTLDTPGVVYVEAHPIRALLELWPGSFTHYGDAAVAAVARSRHLTVLTFDRAFAKSLDAAGVAHKLLT